MCRRAAPMHNVTLKLGGVVPGMRGTQRSAGPSRMGHPGGLCAVLPSCLARCIQSVQTLEAVSLPQQPLRQEVVLSHGHEPGPTDPENRAPKGRVAADPWATSLVRQHRWEESVDVRTAA